MKISKVGSNNFTIEGLNKSDLNAILDGIADNPYAKPRAKEIARVLITFLDGMPSGNPTRKKEQTYSYCLRCRGWHRRGSEIYTKHAAHLARSHDTSVRPKKKLGFFRNPRAEDKPIAEMPEPKGQKCPKCGKVTHDNKWGGTGKCECGHYFKPELYGHRK